MGAAVGVQRRPELEDWAGARFKEQGTVHESNERSIDVGKGPGLSRAPTRRKFYRKNASPRDANSTTSGALPPSIEDIRTLLADPENYLVHVITPGHSRPPSLGEVSRSRASRDDDDVQGHSIALSSHFSRPLEIIPSLLSFEGSRFSMFPVFKKENRYKKLEDPLLTEAVTSYQDADIIDILEIHNTATIVEETTDEIEIYPKLEAIVETTIAECDVLDTMSDANIADILKFDHIGARVEGITDGSESSISDGDVFEEDIVELEFEKLKPKLTTHSMHCPNCLSKIRKVILRRKELLYRSVKAVAHFDNVEANDFGTRESSISGREVLEEEIVELEFEKVKHKLATHSMHCPNCKSEITKVTLRRKVILHRPVMAEPELEPKSLLGCLSLLSLFTCSDDWCFNPFDIFKRRPESGGSGNKVQLEFQQMISKLTSHSMYCLACLSEVREVILHQKLLSVVAESGPKPDPDHIVSVSSTDNWSFDPFDGDEIMDVESEELISKLTTHDMHCLNCKSRIRNVALIKKELLTKRVDPAVTDPDPNPDHDHVGSFCCLSLFTCSDNGWCFNPFDIFRKIQESSDEENTTSLLHENGTSREPYLY